MGKKRPVQSQAKKENKPVTLGDMLNQDLKSKLKVKQQELKKAEEKQKKQEKEAEAERKREAQRQKEKNMSFEELLAKSDMDWKKFK